VLQNLRGWTSLLRVSVPTSKLPKKQAAVVRYRAVSFKTECNNLLFSAIRQLATILLISCAMSILILKNVPNEGPGTIEDFLAAEKREYSVVDLSSEEIPGTENVDTLVILGGHMSVNDADRYPYIHREIELVKDFALKKRRMLGICLGAQIMASAFGARVYPGAEKEIGWADIVPAYQAGSDSLMDSLAGDPETGEHPGEIKVFQWHGETFEMPGGSVRLFRSEAYPNQAFRYGESAYALQFHIEVKEEMIYEWLKYEPVDMDLLKRDTVLYYRQYHRRAVNFYKNFFGDSGIKKKNNGGEK
jgi:GMP synthase (glutamine-hydrolysing)